MAEKKLAGKFIIEGIISCLTGLHIGGNQDVSEIGGIDLLVIRDMVTHEPYMPGSSLKGKLRSLLERYHYAQEPSLDFFNREMNAGGQRIRHHECGREECPICRLFGASRDKNVQENMPASLYVRDAYLTAESKKELQQMESGYYLTEVKFENTLDRITSAANPRQIERVPRGARFNFQMVYNLWEPQGIERLQEDFTEIFIALQLLVDDYLGGHGSRGYGQVRLDDLKLHWRSLRYYQGQEQEVSLAAEKEETINDLARRVINTWLPNLLA
ncbi:type III-A CRISPR-associated RAMP protein Csm3 [Moorella sp. E306M]|uniref:type III-A CRISPR-associated RAMP protein Csm3 n=1 Tax=Moorella sp. E306M TaxID=2572683 RepID=UPI0010FFAB25|nr:type III-A CRISPR-associated RAMP protein Csm3 [Moorella sp. E306M]GEA18923.1 type III-A CRISPR-associated RAMP protein Csm3 [Moorella sp. E306M]